MIVCEPAFTYLEITVDSKDPTVSPSWAFALVSNESEKLLGFTQLYPALCSVDLVRYFVLYDLYVAAPYRRRGVGRGLMAAAKNWALTAGAARVDLETANDNTGAQALYETLGYVRDEVFYKYSLDLK